MPLVKGLTKSKQTTDVVIQKVDPSGRKNLDDAITVDVVNGRWEQELDESTDKDQYRVIEKRHDDETDRYYIKVDRRGNETGSEAVFDGATLGELVDVDLETTRPAGGDGLVYDEDTGLWGPGAAASGESVRTHWFVAESNLTTTNNPATLRTALLANQFTLPEYSDPPEAGEGMGASALNTGHFTLPEPGLWALTVMVSTDPTSSDPLEGAEIVRVGISEPLWSGMPIVMAHARAGDFAMQSDTGMWVYEDGQELGLQLTNVSEKQIAVLMFFQRFGPPA